MPGTSKLGRPTAQRKSMLRGMVTYLLESGSIETTFTRAKEVRALTDKMITIGKKNTLAARREALEFITKREVVTKLFDTIAPQYADRNGGYTEVYKLGQRRGDGAEMAIVRLIKEETVEEVKEEPKKAAKKSTRSGAVKTEADTKTEEVKSETKAAE